MINGSKIKPYPYQAKAIASLERHILNGRQRLLIVLPTGTGKTILGQLFAKRTGRTLWLAHRRELVLQPIRALRQVWPEAESGIVMGQDYDQCGARDFVAASIGSLRSEARLARLQRAGSFDLVIVDEAHHSVAPSWRRVLEELGAWSVVGPTVIGLTATPERADNKALDSVYEKVAYSMPLQVAIRDGWLADWRSERVKLELRLGDVRTGRSGDYNREELEAEMLRAGAAEAVARAVRERCEGRRTLVYVVNVDQAHRTAAALKEEGVIAAVVDASTSEEERTRIREGLEEGYIAAAVNCEIYTEGVDIPCVDALVMARPTKSRSLYTQMLGRGLRRYPAKDHCLVLDVCGVTEAHDVVSAPALFGLPPAETTRSARRALIELAPDLRLEEAQDVKRLRALVEGMDLQTAPERSVAWSRSGERWIVPIEIGTLAIEPEEGEWIPRVRHKDGTVEELSSEPVWLELAQSIAEDYARRHDATRGLYDDDPHARQDASWRQPATERQLALLRKLGRRPARDLTRIEASDIISAALG